MVQNSLLSTLQKLGLTYYEAKAYLALMTLGVAKPSVIAEESGVPRTKIYEVLKKLEKNRWVTIEKSRPSTVTPTYPRKVLEEHKLRFNHEIDCVSNELAMIYNDVIQKEVPKIRIVYSAKSISQMKSEIMGNAKKEIMSMGSLYLPHEADILRDNLLMTKEKHVRIRSITQPQNDADLKTVKNLSQIIEIKEGHGYCLKTIMVDNKEVILIMAKIKDEIPLMEDVIAVWITSPSLTSCLASVFEMEWKNLKYYTYNK